MKIEILYPELADLFGDRGNITYLKLCLPQAEFIHTSLLEKPYFVDNDVDMIYMGPASEINLDKIMKQLTPYRERIRQLFDNGTLVILMGNACEIFGGQLSSNDGHGFTGMQLLDMTFERNMHMMERINNPYIGKYEDIEVIGFQSQFTKAYAGEKVQPLFETISGFGINGKDSYEGIRYNNVFVSYLIGPLFVMNPLFVRKLLKLLNAEPQQLPYEEEIMLAYNRRLEDFHKKIVK